MAQPKGTHFVVTAADTDSGAPLYLKRDGSWTLQFAEASALASSEERDGLLQAALQQERAACDPYAFSVVMEDGRPVALSKREQIRAEGPTTPLRRPD